MEIAVVKLVYGKWHCYGPDGRDWCAFSLRAWAEECAHAHGWNVAVE